MVANFKMAVSTCCFMTEQVCRYRWSAKNIVWEPLTPPFWGLVLKRIIVCGEAACVGIPSEARAEHRNPLLIILRDSGAVSANDIRDTKNKLGQMPSLWKVTPSCLSKLC